MTSASANLVEKNTRHLRSIVDRLKVIPIHSSSSSSKNSKKKEQNNLITKTTNYLDASTLRRLDACSDSFIGRMFGVLDDFGVRDAQLSDALKNYDDWSALVDRERLHRATDQLRHLNYIKPDMFARVIAHNEVLLQRQERHTDQQMLEWMASRVNSLKEFFTRKQTNLLMTRTPSVLLTANIDSIRYTYGYVYFLMGKSAEEMCASRVFSHRIEHVRARHLFLTRAGLYAKPNKQNVMTGGLSLPSTEESSGGRPNAQINGQTLQLKHIVDLPLTLYLKQCTHGILSKEEYHAFSDCLAQQNETTDFDDSNETDGCFDNELLGNKMVRSFRNQLLGDIKAGKKQRRQQQLQQEIE